MKDYTITQEKSGIKVKVIKEIATIFVGVLTQDFEALFFRNSLSEEENLKIIRKNQHIIVDYIYSTDSNKAYFEFLLGYHYIKLYFDDYIRRDLDAIGPYISPEDINIQRYYDFIWDLYITLKKIK